MLAEPGQKVAKTRRDYNRLVANEMMEDYALRYVPASFRKWSELLVANAALGGISFLALEAIGASVAISFGFPSACWAILVVGGIIFLTGLPITYYAVKYHVDIDLLTRGAGFGYVGSTITSLIYASFTFIFFALEASIMAQALELYFHIPLALGYVLCSVVVIPLVFFGITLISQLQVWTQPLWLAMMVAPYAFIYHKAPETFSELLSFVGKSDNGGTFSALSFGAAATVSFSLIAQIGEQVDYLRFMPDKGSDNRVKWWLALLSAGPGWIILGVAKQLGGAFLAFLAIRNGLDFASATHPVQMYLAGYGYVVSDPDLALGLTILFVVISQVKINVTNAYAGSLAWSNFFSRITHSHPGRVVWLLFNIVIALVMMELGAFEALNKILGLYANVAIAWIGAVTADLIVNKPLGLSPPMVEFRRAHLYNFNPVGTVSMLVASVVSIAAYIGIFGPYPQAYAPFIAVSLAFLLAPLIALLTRGRYYIARSSGSSDAKPDVCIVCDQTYVTPDTTHCAAYEGSICSLCCTLDASCQDMCKKQDGFHSPIGNRFRGVLLSRYVRFLTLFLLSGTLVAGAFWLVYSQTDIVFGPQLASGAIRDSEKGFINLFAVIMVLLAVGVFLFVLTQESHWLAEDETADRNRLLKKANQDLESTIESLRRMQEQLVEADKMAALGGLVAGVAHEINTPIGVVLTAATHLEVETGRTDALYRAGDLSEDGLTDYFGTARQAVQLMTLNSKRASDLIQSFKQVAVDQTGGERRTFNLASYIDEVLLSLQPHLKKTLITVTVVCPTDILVDSLPGALSQVLSNLIMNSLTHAFDPEQSGHIDITARMADQAGEWVELIYRDDGCGIPVELRTKVFDPFFTTRRAKGGSGLGLHIVFNIMHQSLKGSIELANTSDRGAVFTLRFPRNLSPSLFPRRL